MSSSSGSTVEIEATGVLVDPTLSCTLLVNEDAPTEALILELRKQLQTQYNDFFKPSPPLKLGPLDLLIAVDSNTNTRASISTLSIPQSGKTFTVNFKMPETHTFRAIFNKNKENQAQLEQSHAQWKQHQADVNAQRLIEEEAMEQTQTASKSSRSKKKKASSAARGPAVDNNPSFQEMIDNMRQEFMGEINDLKVSRTEQAEQIKDLKASNAKLSASNEEMSVIQQRHSTTLHALHRRMVLDDARELLGTRYGFTISELRLGGQGVVAGKPKALQQLVRDVRSKLNKEDARLLHDDALNMIFDSSRGTVCSDGNVVAHRASKEDLGLAIKWPDLTTSQAATLKDIYAFTHHDIPQF